MVESIKNLTKSVEVPRTSSNKSSGLEGSKTGAVSASAGVDSVDVSGSLPATTLAEFNKKPPIDVETVSRIKDAIAKGEYPINLDAVADMLLDAYKDMKS